MLGDILGIECQEILLSNQPTAKPHQLFRLDAYTQWRKDHPAITSTKLHFEHLDVNLLFLLLR